MQTSLLVVDMQRYFVDVDYPLGKIWLAGAPEDTAAYFDRVNRVVVPNIKRLLGFSRRSEMPVYFTAFGSLTGDGSDLPDWAQRHNAYTQQTVGRPMYPPATDPSWSIHDSVRPAPGEEVLAKITSGTLSSTDLDERLRLRGVESVVVTGVTTNICVAATAEELVQSGFAVVIPEDACAASSERAHAKGIEAMTRAGAHVCSAASIVDQMLS